MHVVHLPHIASLSLVSWGEGHKHEHASGCLFVCSGRGVSWPVGVSLSQVSRSVSCWILPLPPPTHTHTQYTHTNLVPERCQWISCWAKPNTCALHTLRHMQHICCHAGQGSQHALSSLLGGYAGVACMPAQQGAHLCCRQGGAKRRADLNKACFAPLRPPSRPLRLLKFRCGTLLCTHCWEPAPCSPRRGRLSG
jgi:hypothetical protein